MKKIGYMGIEGSFSEMAAEKLAEQLFAKKAELLPMVSAQNIKEALQAGEIAYGVVGVSNTSVGEVHEFHEAFCNTPYKILGEYVLPVHHCLYKKAGVPTAALTTVASHIHALAQTEKTRREKYPQLNEQEAEDTALAAMQLAEGLLPDTTAVICSKNAGARWNLALVEENLEDCKDNRTIFWLIEL